MKDNANAKQERKAVKIKPETMEKINKIVADQRWSKTTTIDVAIAELYAKVFGQGK